MSRALRLAVPVALLLALLSMPQTAGAVLPPPEVPESAAVKTAGTDDNVIEATREHPDLHPSVDRNDGTGDWEVSYFTGGNEVVQVVVDDTSGKVEESWTGEQVAWRMARGYPGAFGRKLNAPYVWIPLCAMFVIGLFDWRRPLRIAHLDLLVIVGGFGLSHFFFNRGDIGVSVPLAYPPLLYLLGRAIWLGFRRGSGLRPSMPIVALAVGAVFLTGVRVGLNVADSNVIDVGLSGVIGADRIADRDALYGEFPEVDQSGDTYGPMAYYAYVPFEQMFPWSGRWDELPAAHAAAIFFELGTLAGLFLLGRQLRRGREGTELGVLLCFAWSACPYTAFALESNTNDSLVSMLLVATLLLLNSPPGRGVLLALASATKFAPLILAPLFATFGATEERRGAAPTGGVRGEASTEDNAVARRWMGPPRATGPVGRYARAIAPFAAAFAVTGLAVMAETLIDPGLSTFWDRSIGNQAGRDSPFSVWGQAPSLEWLHTAVKVFAIALAALIAFRPRRRDPLTVAALGAAAIIALQLTIDHWFYLYLPWFLPFLFVALLGLGWRGREEYLLDTSR